MDFGYILIYIGALGISLALLSFAFKQFKKTLGPGLARMLDPQPPQKIIQYVVVEREGPVQPSQQQLPETESRPLKPKPANVEQMRVKAIEKYLPETLIEVFDTVQHYPNWEKSAKNQIPKMVLSLNAIKNDDGDTNQGSAFGTEMLIHKKHYGIIFNGAGYICTGNNRFGRLELTVDGETVFGLDVIMPISTAQGEFRKETVRAGIVRAYQPGKWENVLFELQAEIAGMVLGGESSGKKKAA